MALFDCLLGASFKGLQVHFGHWRRDILSSCTATVQINGKRGHSALFKVDGSLISSHHHREGATVEKELQRGITAVAEWNTSKKMVLNGDAQRHSSPQTPMRGTGNPQLLTTTSAFTTIRSQISSESRSTGC